MNVEGTTFSKCKIFLKTYFDICRLHFGNALIDLTVMKCSQLKLIYSNNSGE